MMAQKESDKLGAWQLQRWLQNQKRSRWEKDVVEDETRNETSWLPAKNLRKSIHLLTLLALIMFLVLTGFFLFVLDLSKSGDGPSESEGGLWILKFGLTITSISLGFCLSLCVEQWRTGNLNRSKATKIRTDARKQISQMSICYKRTMSSMRHVPISKDPELFKMFLFFLSQRKIEAEEFLHNMANEIQELGYDHKEFLKERMIDYQETINLADQIVRMIYDSPYKDSIPKNFIEDVKITPFFQNLDRVEQQEISSSETGDDLESKI